MSNRREGSRQWHWGGMDVDGGSSEKKGGDG